MIHIEAPKVDVVITKQAKLGDVKETHLSSVYGFTEYRLIPRRVPGLYMFYNENGELLYCGKSSSLRSRVRTHFYDTVSAIRHHRHEVHRIEVSFIEDAYEREIYETFMIHKFKAKYNIDKVFYN